MFLHTLTFANIYIIVNRISIILFSHIQEVCKQSDYDTDLANIMLQFK